MADKDIKEFIRRVKARVASRRLYEAISMIKDMARKNHVIEVVDSIERTEQNYAYMLQYLTRGIKDPQRDSVYQVMINDIYAQLEALECYLASIDSPTLYYSNIRYRRSTSGLESLASMMQRYRKEADKLSLFSMVLDADRTDDKLKDRVALERLQSDLFIRIWSTPRLSSDEAEAVASMLESQDIKPEMQQFVVSALMLGLLERYDMVKLELLMKVYLSSPHIDVSSAALVGMLIGLWRYSDRPLDNRLEKIMQTIKDRDQWRSDLRVAFIELIRARDTERINRKMRDEVIPKMQKIRPDMIEKFNEVNLDADDQMSLHENPQWQDLLDKSGITDQLKEITEIQMEGGDVMMSTFAHLKGFTFFQTISNWFLPYDPENTVIAQTARSLDVIADVMENSGFMCDSDKYSFMLAVNSVPQQQRDLMVSQMRSQSDAILEMINNRANNTNVENLRLSVNRYVQNIYRFFKLFYRKQEFSDPFDQSLNLVSVPSLADTFDDPELLRVVAEFYFKLNFMQEALVVYSLLDSLSEPDAARYQKLGYCCESCMDYPMAADYYSKALLLGPDDNWTMRRLAAVYRKVGKKAEALDIYRQLATMQPDDVGAAMLYGQSLLANDELREAIHEFYRIEFMDESYHKVWRPLAWALLLAGDFEESMAYYDKIIDEAPTATDFLNRGHVALALNDMQSAVDNYTKALRAAGADGSWLVQAIDRDRSTLDSVGVDQSLLPLVVDAVLYNLNS